MVSISPEFTTKFQQGYLEDPVWKTVLNTTKQNVRLGESSATLATLSQNQTLARPRLPAPAQARVE